MHHTITINIVGSSRGLDGNGQIVWSLVDYELVRRSAGWLVFNVIIEGVSYVRNFRAELDSEINASSLDAVIARLESEAGIAGDE